uniref:Uncharacterized protein n=1 Tax=Cucumis melo TaxID=3656 RepID=A0A9I9DIW8_CUCME
MADGAQLKASAKGILDGWHVWLRDGLLADGGSLQRRRRTMRYSWKERRRQIGHIEKDSDQKTYADEETMTTAGKATLAETDTTRRRDTR